MTKRIIYRGPSGILYSHKEYEVLSETDNGWMIKDDQGVVTNVSKKINMYWGDV